MKSNLLLSLENLSLKYNENEILKNINLKIFSNQIHVLMGPNGSGKSTLSKFLSGVSNIVKTQGRASLNNRVLEEYSTEERFFNGLFLAYQHPIEINGLTTFDLLLLAYNEKKKHFLQKELNPFEFLEVINPIVDRIQFKEALLYRNFNEGFSGGERKLTELLQILLFQPKLVILDELDSGVDIDITKTICTEIARMKQEGVSFLIITHQIEFLERLDIDYIHVLKNGNLIISGQEELKNKIKSYGFSSF